ncbi:MAG: hypothetical protein IJZ34_05460 [Lachnospiraceae bacterium]|nr:hypothetical protein [Lachnospiraceae bacterium]
MDKFEYKVRAEEIKSLIASKEYVQAAEIADMIDWRRVKSVMMLCTVSDLYKINRRYEDARDMLLLAYDRHPGGRTIVYSLCELCIKTEEIVEAVEYYKEFIQIAPRDTGRYILQYKLYEAQDVSLEERIAVLEELKQRDYREKWAYELAYLYHRVGLATRCVEECDELILWFGDGKYVLKALELKMLHQPLTLQQQQKYESRLAPQYEEPIQETEYSDSEYAQPEECGQDAGYDQQAEYTQTAEVTQPVAEEVPASEEEFDIHVKTMDVSQFNTINLQKELAEGLKEVLGEPEASPEELSDEPVDDQIEGQLSLEDIVEEWNRLKREAAMGEDEVCEPEEELPRAEADELEEVADGADEVEELSEEVNEVEELTEAVNEVEQLTEAEDEIEDLLEVEEVQNIEELEDVEEVQNIKELEDAEEVQGIKELEDAEEVQGIEELEEIEEIEEIEEVEEIEEIEETDDEAVIEDETEEAAREEEIQEEEQISSKQKSSEQNTAPGGTGKARVRNLTREERELFGSYIHSRSARQKLLGALDKISLASYTGNVIVTGDEGMDTLEMAKNIIRDVQMNDSNFSGKTAKISGIALNQKDVSEILEQLKNGALIIQKISDISEKTVEALYRKLQQESFGIILVIEDTKRNMNKFLAKHKKLEECFNARVDMEAMSNEELVAFGKKYAREMEYTIDDLGVLALHTRIEEMQTLDHAVTVMEVRDIVDEAIDHANRKTVNHFLDVLLAKRYDEEDMIILREKDFI